MAKISLTISILTINVSGLNSLSQRECSLNYEEDFSVYLQAISVYFYIKIQETQKKEYRKIKNKWM